MNKYSPFVIVSHDLGDMCVCVCDIQNWVISFLHQTNHIKVVWCLNLYLNFVIVWLFFCCASVIFCCCFFILFSLLMMLVLRDIIAKEDCLMSSTFVALQVTVLHHSVVHCSARLLSSWLLNFLAFVSLYSN